MSVFDPHIIDEFFDFRVDLDELLVAVVELQIMLLLDFFT